MIALWASLAWSAPVGCDAPTERRTFDAALARAELAMSELDAAQLRDAVAAADQAFACLDEALGPPDVARWFRLAGFSRAVDGDPRGAQAWFAAARALEPAWQLDRGLGGALRDTWEGTPLAVAPPVALPPPAEGWLQVDGRRATAAPVDRPFALQRFDAAGAVADNALQAVGAPLPPWPVAAAASSAAPPPAAPRTGTHRALLWSGVGAGVAAAGTGAGGWITRQRFRDPALGYAEVEGLVPLNHALNVSAASLGATATGLLLGALLTAR